LEVADGKHRAAIKEDCRWEKEKLTYGSELNE
jgi:hypothetical protein